MSKKNQELIKSIVNEEAQIPCMIDLYKEVIGMSEIERYKLEDFVIRELLKKTSITQIVNMLKEKYPSGNFNRKDVEKFIERSSELNQILNREKNSLARRWLTGKAQIAEEIAQLAAYTKHLIPQLRNEKDNSNTLKAIVALNNIFVTYAELEGVRKKQSQINTQVNVNLDKIEKLRERAHKADFVVDVTNDEVSTQSEPESEDESSDS